MNRDSMKSDREKADVHARARMMIAVYGARGSGAERDSSAGLSHAEQSWLAGHLETCVGCREFEENSRQAISAMRGISMAANSGLVAATQMRVRQRAAELQRQQERLWVVCACCAAVTLSAVVTTAALWRGFAWMGEQARLSAPVWEGGFAVFYLMPAVLAGIILLARGTFLADHKGFYQH